MWKTVLIFLAVTGLHAVPLRDNVIAPIQSKNIVPTESRRQGTQPSRRHMINLNTGLLIDYVSEMNRRTGNYYVPPSTDQYRQGTQNSQTTLVDLKTGLVITPVGEMERTYGPIYVPPSLNNFRQGTQNSQTTLIDQKTGEVLQPVGEMQRSNMLSDAVKAEPHAAMAEPKCAGEVINSQCYYFFSTPQTFKEAESTCGQLSPNGHLASVTSPDLHSRLVFMVTEANNGPVLTWLGGVLQGDQLRWSDGSSWTYSDWMPGQPRTDALKKTCLEMFNSGKRWWSAADCESKRAFICSYLITA